MTQLELGQHISKTLDEITYSPSKCLDFLCAASNLYKYDFENILAMYFQMPEATAVADYDVWTKVLKCKINNQARGIRIFSNTTAIGTYARMFDVSQTNGAAALEKSKWRFDKEHHGTILSAIFETTDNVMNAAAMYNAYLNNFNDDFDSIKEPVYYAFAAKCATIVTLTRLGIEVDSTLFADFENTFSQLSVIQKVSALEHSIDISKENLINIERGIKNGYTKNSSLEQQSIRSDGQHDNNRGQNNAIPIAGQEHPVPSAITSRRDSDLRHGRNNGTRREGSLDGRGSSTADLQPSSAKISPRLSDTEIQGNENIGRAFQSEVQDRQGLFGKILTNGKKNDGNSNRKPRAEPRELGGLRTENNANEDDSKRFNAPVHVGNLRPRNTDSRIDTEIKLPIGSFIFVGETIEFNGREYYIESVNRELDKIDLADLTFQKTNGYPIYNANILSIVEDYVGAQIINEADYLPMMQGVAVEEQPKTSATLEDLLTPLPLDNTAQLEIKADAPLTLADLISMPSAAETSATVDLPQAKQTSMLISAEANATDYIITDEIEITGAKSKFKANIEAIKLIRLLQEENRNATPEEQTTLSLFSGWGGLSSAFDDSNSSWANEYSELKSLLSDEEYILARASTLTSFYTSKVVIDSIYNALLQFGFEGGNILEPSASVGRFIGCMPEQLRKNSNIYAVEIDSVPSDIAQKLYPSADVFCGGFEDTSYSNNFFDAAIGNVPFGDYKVFDTEYNKLNFNIHDYFFAKTVDKVAPGGVIAFVTSKGTLDKKDAKARKYIFERCDLIGAIRLPNTAFKGAGTEVTSDIIFLQKRELLRSIEDIPYLNTTDIGDGIEVNTYFAENPGMMLGVMSKESNMYGSDNVTTLKPLNNGQSLDVQLASAISHLHATMKKVIKTSEDELQIAVPPNSKNFALCIIEDKIYFRQNSEMVLLPYTRLQKDKIVSFCKIRDALHELLELQPLDNVTDDELAEARAALNTAYDDFVKKFGNLSLRVNEKLFQVDCDSNLISALEYDDNGSIKKAPIFTKRTVAPVIVPQSADNAADALALSLNQRGIVDFEYMASLLNVEKDIILNELTGLIFLNPKKMDAEDIYHGYESSNEYLSGDIREKIGIAKIYAETDKRFQRNITALTEVIPKPIPPGEIVVRIGAPWIDDTYYNQFMYELFKTPSWKQIDHDSIYNSKSIGVSYNKFLNSYNISNSRSDNSVNVTSIYGTRRMNAYEIMHSTLNLQEAVVKDAVPTISRNGTDTVKYVVNVKETEFAREKQKIIQEKFGEWIFADKSRRDALCDKYNQLFNSIRHPVYDGSRLELPGMNAAVKLQPQQLNAVARLRSGNNTLLAHVVGSGKTYSMIAGGMEQLRLGLANKAMFVVPNHLIGQFSADAVFLYPNINMLVSTKLDSEKANRQKFLSRIAMGDANFIIIGHSQFEKITMSAEFNQRETESQIAEISNALSDLAGEHGAHYTVKQLEKTKASLEVKLKKLGDDATKDKMITFEQLGVNSLFVDEAHYYKNCSIFSKMRNVAGVSNAGSKKAFDMLMKSRYIIQICGIVVFATGTTISNSICEAYVMQRYLQNELLNKRGIRCFDEWAACFGETTTSLEPAPEGGGYRLRTRFASFHNLPELMQLFRVVADIQTADMLNLPIPKLAEGKPIVVSCEPSPELESFMKTGVERVEAIRDGRVQPYEDNMLKFIVDFRKAGLDMRLIDNNLDFDLDGKLAACASNVYKHYLDSDDMKGTQLIFCDTSTYNTSKPFDVYREEKCLLVAMGIPENEIEFIHMAKTDNQKEDLFAKVRSGAVRVLIGSTQKCGAGTNIQDRLVALHHLDCPYRPSDIEQREGRILRQHNMNDIVSIYRYVTKRSFDSYLWHIVEVKQKFISQLMRGETTERTCNDLDDVSIGFAEAQAIASGDPRIKEKIELDIDVRRLGMLKSQHLNEQYNMQDMVVETLPKELSNLNSHINALLKDKELRNSVLQNQTEFRITLNNNVFDIREKAGAYLLSLIKVLPIATETAIGAFMDFKISFYTDNLFSLATLRISANSMYEIELNLDTAHGNIIRIENAIKGIDQNIADAQRRVSELTQSLESLKQQLGMPFAREAELAEKLCRLNTLNSALDVGGVDNTFVDDEQLQEESLELLSSDNYLEL